MTAIPTVRRRFPAWVLALGLVFVAVAPAEADFEAGQRAWDAGRPAQAVAAWHEAGDGRAMLVLGGAYAKGLGAPQDFVEAHKWLNLAAGLGSVEAAAERDALAKEMTAEEQAEARKLARAWRIRDTRAAADAAPVKTSTAAVPVGRHRSGPCGWPRNCSRRLAMNRGPQTGYGEGVRSRLTGVFSVTPGWRLPIR